MNRFLPRDLNITELRRLGGPYCGVIASVVEELLHNHFTKQKAVQPVIVFDDAYRLIPNITMRRALVERFGSDTDTWPGQRLIVSCSWTERVDPATGTVRKLAIRHLAFPDDAGAHEPKSDDEVDDAVPF